MLLVHGEEIYTRLSFYLERTADIILKFKTKSASSLDGALAHFTIVLEQSNARALLSAALCSLKDDLTNTTGDDADTIMDLLHSVRPCGIF